MSTLNRVSNAKPSNVGSIVLDGRYEVIAEIKGALGEPKQFLGAAETCRYCGTIDNTKFRNNSHTFPEALGNKWVFSRDECDDCNKKFSSYDNELVNSIKPFLTLGGVQGKNGIVQTGRTNGPATIRKRAVNQDGGVSFSANVQSFDKSISANCETEVLEIQTPIDPTKFKPRFAYKALVKMAVALLPSEELENYKLLIKWLEDPNDRIDFPKLEVAISLGSVMDAPPLVVGTLLRRIRKDDIVPHILFILCAGSICFQIDLRSDELENHLPPVPDRSINITWDISIGKPETGIQIFYSKPIHYNWASSVNTLQPLETVVMRFNNQTQLGSLDFLKRNNYALDLEDD